MRFITILTTIFIASEICFAYPIIVMGSDDYWGDDDFESGWSEYGDLSQQFWQYDGSRVNINRADAEEIATLPGITDHLADAIVTEREKNGRYDDTAELAKRTELPVEQISRLRHIIQFEDPIDLQGRLHIRANRRYGADNDGNMERYDWSPVALTQRYMLSNNSLQFGATFDKDRYEPDITDLRRFYVSYERDKFKIIAGDFHINHGTGLALWTRPSYFTGLHSASAYRLNRQGIQPAKETTQNSGLRGLAIQREWGGGGLLDVFYTKTRYDAILNDTLLNRLSDGGLHRTEGESEKKNTVSESAGGWILAIPFDVNEWNVRVSSASYLASYDRMFKPRWDARDPFPLTGYRAGAAGLNFDVARQKELRTVRYNFEVSKSENVNLAWSFISEYSLHKSHSLRTMFYRYPVNYVNPHAKPPPGSSKPQNCDGAAMLLKIRPDFLKIDRMSAHIEAKRTTFRTYTIPHPTASVKGSVMCSWSVSNGSDVTLLCRQKIAEEGNGEQLPTDDINEQKLRFTVSSIPLLDQKCKIWIETASRVVNSDPALYGILTGVQLTGNVWRSLRYNLGGSYFNSHSGHYLYQGEYGLPDRLASIRLSGSGVRINGSISMRNGRTNWIGAQIARTVKFSGESGDMELYVTCSYSFDQSLLRWD